MRYSGGMARVSRSAHGQDVSIRDAGFARLGIRSTGSDI